MNELINLDNFEAAALARLPAGRRSIAEVDRSLVARIGARPRAAAASGGAR